MPDLTLDSSHERELEIVERYRWWISDNVGSDSGYGKCREVTAAMADRFPELDVRFGFFDSMVWGRRQHFWCRTPDGRIVDPTGRQHPDGTLFPSTDYSYEDLTDLSATEMAKRVPTGRCMNCGEDVYGGGGVCSDRCAKVLEAEYG